MIRRPPRSTLFPTRRSSDLGHVGGLRDPAGAFGAVRDQCEHARSEEHTSELQSRRDLVCRLLLEKKKTKLSLSSNNLLMFKHSAQCVIRSEEHTSELQSPVH